MTAVRLEGLTKRFVAAAAVAAVDAVDLSIESGEFVVLVGPSGSGKTTCLRMIAGLETVTAGSIYIGDRDVANVHAKDRDVAMVFQSYALYPHMSVADNMGFALKLRKLPRDEIDRRIRDVATILGIAEELPRKPKTLSGGQQQRVALGTGDRAGSSGLPVRRAALQFGRQAAHGDARRVDSSFITGYRRR